MGASVMQNIDLKYYMFDWDDNILFMPTLIRMQHNGAAENVTTEEFALVRNDPSYGPIDGDWGSKTSAALKRFERDHDLRADGKLDALTLITLGLGPQRHAAVIPQQPAEEAEK